MLNFKGMRFPIDVILVCIRWYVAYPLSYRHLEEMMEERGVSVDHSSIVTVQPLWGERDRIAVECPEQYLKHAMALFA